jgi:Flp pilus assembly protein TadG
MRVLKGRSSGRRRGAAATELALILPVLIMIVFGCVDFGRFAYDLIAVTNAARAGAASGIMNNYTATTLGTTTTPGTWKGNVAAAAKAEMADYLPANITVTVPNPTTDANGLKRVDVTVSYTFQSIVNWNWPGLGIPHNPTITRTVEMRLIR